MKRQILSAFLLLIPVSLMAQVVSVSEQDLFRGGNINLVKLVADNKNYKGSPYLNDTFENTALVFDSNRGFEGPMRYHMGYQIFEFKNAAGERFKILPASDFKLVHQGKSYVRDKIRLKSEGELDGVFQLLWEGQHFRVLRYLKKELEQARKDGIPAPATGSSDGPLPTWIDRSYYVIAKSNEGIRVENSHKKMIKLNFFNAKVYKTYTDQRKVKLKNEEALLEMVAHLDQNTP